MREKIWQNTVDFVEKEIIIYVYTIRQFVHSTIDAMQLHYDTQFFCFVCLHLIALGNIGVTRNCDILATRATNLITM